MKNGSGMECRRDGEILQKMELNGKRNETLCSERGSNDLGVVGPQDRFKPRKLIQWTGLSCGLRRGSLPVSHKQF